MIFIGLGANLPSRFGTPEETFKAVLARLKASGIVPVKVSSVWKSAPVPVSDQPWYKNAVVQVQTSLKAPALIALLQSIEKDFGRQRTERNAPRLLDLDLLAYHDLTLDDPQCEIPHPRMHQRAFVLNPLQEIAPDWRHPVLGLALAELIAALPPGQVTEFSESLAA